MTDASSLFQLVQETPWPIARSPLLIAEIGINHNGDVGIAKQLIDLAQETGCDAVKFQKRTLDVIYTKEFLDSPRESPWGTTQREQKQGLEFEKPEYDEIDAYCREVGIDWFASAWDVESQVFLRQYELAYNKIASAMLTHAALLETVAEEKKLTFISAGMSSYDDIDAAVAVFRRHGCPFVLMHTVSEYPAAEDQLNLRSLHDLRQRYDCPVGYSGHEVSPIPSAIAAVMGAVAIERHITLDRAMYGSDQAASLERRGLELLVAYIRTIPAAVGSGERAISPGERANALKLRYWHEPSGEPTGGR